MRFSRVTSFQPHVLDACKVSVEADLSRGLHSFSIVGLPDKAVEEAKDRVCAAIKHAGFTSPKSTNHKIVISLAPADVRKEGPLFDLPIALAYLFAAEVITFDQKQMESTVFIGELALDGSLRPVSGVLAIAQACIKEGFTTLVLPKENAKEAALIKELTVYGAKNLREVLAHTVAENGEGDETKNTTDGERLIRTTLTKQPQTHIEPKAPEYLVDFCDIRGQETAKRGLLIAASGRHNAVMYGPPGTGKTLLARAFASLLPPLTFSEALEVTKVHSVAGVLKETILTYPPFRAPHHSASHVALVGGGANPKPGEVTLAHRGVLFLDEFPEFERRVIDALRQPLEDRVVTVSRARGTVSFPANVILLAAMNPSRGLNSESGTVSELDRLRLERKISGPIMDRVDLWIEVGSVDHAMLGTKGSGEESVALKEQVLLARKRQAKRFKNESMTNADLSVKELDALVPLSPSVRELLNESARALNLSARAYHRLIKLSRTIADLDDSQEIEEEHLLEALQYRPRKLFG